MPAIKELSKKQDTMWEWGSLVIDIIDMSLECSECLFAHINRSANVLAHNLSKCFCIAGDSRMWWRSLPPTDCNSDSLS
ncbi:hypothetical protein REPUB_Repub05bG0026500 [Reevesia pubescens]